MKLEFHMVTEFGEFLADGHLGNQFRNLRIESVWDHVESVTFDFAGVINLTDSFVHATFGNMAECGSVTVATKKATGGMPVALGNFE